MPVANVRSKWVSGDLVFHESVTGNGAMVEFGENDDGLDVKFFGATSGAYMLWDESADSLILTGGATLDVGAVNLTGALTVGVDGTGYDVTFYGDTASALFLWDQSDDALELNGDSRLDFSGNTVKAGNTDGGLIKAGTSGARVVEDTANMKFLSFYLDNGATSGDNRGMYLRLYLTGAGGGGEALRVFTTVEDVAAGTAHGAHLSLNFGSTGSVTGLGIASRDTIHVPNAALSGGTYAAVQAEIYADGASSDISGATRYSFIRAIADGNATGIGNIDDNANFIEFVGVTAASGRLIDTDITTHTAYAGIPIYVPGVGVKYLAVVSD